MTYPYIESVAELQRKLRDLLNEQLGVFANGKKSIFVEPPSAPKGSITGGVQCIITRYRNVSTVDNFGGGDGGENFEWIVSITAIDTSDAGLKKFDDAIAVMRENFPLRRETIMHWNDLAYPMVTYRLGSYSVYGSKCI
jgi:hypothetical protein